MPQLSALDILDKYGSLGPDFLTWLWVSSEREDLPAPPSEPGLQVTVLGPIVLSGGYGEATKITLAGDEAPAAPESLAARRGGKRAVRAKLEFRAQDAVWTFTLDAETFDIKAAKVPVPKIPDENEYLMQRVQALQHLDHLLGELFETFLQIRLDPARWPGEAASWG